MPLNGRYARYAGVFAACMVLGLPGAVRQGVAQTATDDELAKGVTVTVVKATKACFAATVEVFGLMLPVEEISVTPPREGLRITQVLIDPGATVTSGQALVRLTQPEGGETTLVAPVAGTVSAVSAVIGTMASVRSDPLFRIIARGEFELVGDVSAPDMAKLAAGQTLGVVGESGSGKTTLGLALLRLISSNGPIVFLGKDIQGLRFKAMRPFRQIVTKPPPTGRGGRGLAS